MKFRKVIALSLLSNILLASFAIAQSNVNASATINITIVKALQINQIKGDLAFDDFVQSGVSTKVERTPEQGILFEVTGSAGRNVVVDYKNTSLQNNISNENDLISNKSLQFKPKVKTTFTNSNYSNPEAVSNGSAYELAQKDDSGVLYLWVGGEMDIDSQLPSGDYSGDFAITVSY